MSRLRSPTGVAFASMAIAVLALTFSLGGFAGAKDETAKGEVQLLTTATASIDGPNGEGGEVGMYEAGGATFTQEAGATLLLVADLSSAVLPDGCWLNLTFGVDLDDDAIPDELVEGLEIRSVPVDPSDPDQGWHTAQSGTNVLSVAPSASDVGGMVMAFERSGCPGESDPFTVDLEVAVLALQ